MAGLTSSGVGSGLDINSLVTQLVAVEKETPQKQITRAQASTVTTISALGNLKGALGSFNSALSPLKSLDAFSARTASSSEPEVFTATTTSKAAAGTYAIEVVHTASAHQIKSDEFATGAGQVVGTGTLTLTVGGKTFQVGIDAAHKTLAGIRDAINDAVGNVDLVDATIVNATDGAHLVLSAVTTGANSAISIAQADGDGGLASLVYNPSLLTNYSEGRPARDAEVAVAGFIRRSATNTVTDVIDGVTLSLVKEDVGTIHTLTVATDKAGVTAKIKSFVDSYNSLQSTLANLRRYEPATKTAGPLLGDAMLRGIETQIRTTLSDAGAGGSGAFRTLASIGITTGKDGSMSLDNAKLGAAMTANYDGVARMFGAENGVAARLSGAITPRLAADAELDVRGKRLNQKSVELQKQQAELETRMVAVEKRLRTQFTALDGLLSKLQSTSSFLTQQLSSISKIGSNG